MTMQATIVEFDIESYVLRSAVTSRHELYLIECKKVIGKVRWTSGRSYRDAGLYERVSITPDDDATRAYFQNDPRMIDGKLYGVYYDGIFGDRWLSGDESDGPLYADTKVVDRLEFDMGICHPQFKDVEGFGSYNQKRDRMRIHTKHKARRPRSSNKIKKISKV